MNSKFCRACYNRAIVPFLLGGARVISPWHEKVRDGLAGREGLRARAAAFRSMIGDKPLILFHCASAGELEALKPLLPQFDRREVSLAVSYFSPSARSALTNGSDFDFADFGPLDAEKDVCDYLNALRPSLIAITKHDVWPNLVWQAAARGIPLFMVNGNFHPRSLKHWPLVSSFQASVYTHFREILTVSDEDTARAQRIVGQQIPVTTFGDSRFDRVLERVNLNNPLPEGIEPLCANRTVIVAGSTHDEDEELLLPVVARLRKIVPDLMVICVPHDPSQSARRRIARRCSRYRLPWCDLDNGVPASKPAVLLVNRSRLLADLYRVGHVAYVGGGFGRGVHSVLEPMACGLPVVCGPNMEVSSEAREALQAGVLQVTRSWERSREVLAVWLTDRDGLNALRHRARSFVEVRSGVATRLAARLSEAILG